MKQKINQYNNLLKEFKKLQVSYNKDNGYGSVTDEQLISNIQTRTKLKNELDIEMIRLQELQSKGGVK